MRHIPFCQHNGKMSLRFYKQCAKLDAVRSKCYAKNPAGNEKGKEETRMKKFTPRIKLSKRKKKELDAQKRSTWEGINPVTRKSESKKLYTRKKTPYMDDGPHGVFLFQGYAPSLRHLCALL